MMKAIVVLLIVVTTAFASPAPIETVVTSKTMKLDNKQRVFTYEGEVKVSRADMRMQADTLTGAYTEDSKITILVAKNNVTIIQGQTTAKGQRADYDAIRETVVLTENPEVTQGDNILLADKITIYLKENRSEAEGNVRVKLVEQPKEATSSQALLPTPSQ